MTGIRRRLLALVALHVPGAESTRIHIHRFRGVRIGSGCFIGTDVIVETEYPQLVVIGNRVDIGMRTTIIAHQQGEGTDERRPPCGSRTTSSSGPAQSSFLTSRSARAPSSRPAASFRPRFRR